MADNKLIVENVGCLKDVLDFISVHSNKIDLKRIQEAAFNRRRKIVEFETDKIDWRVGMTVKIRPEYVQKGLGGIIGLVTKVNPKKVVVLLGNQAYNIHKYMLEEADPNEENS